MSIFKATSEKNVMGKIKKVFTIGIAYSFQKVKRIPTNKYDVKLDLIITEKQK